MWARSRKVTALSLFLLASCTNSDVVSSDPGEPTGEEEVQEDAVLDTDVQAAVDAFLDDVPEVRDYDPDSLTVFSTNQQGLDEHSDLSKIQISRVESENAFSNTDNSLGYVNSTLPVSVLLSNRTGAPATIGVETSYFGSCDEV
jgi:hypothetical protein